MARPDDHSLPENPPYPLRMAGFLAIAAIALRVGVLVWRRAHDPLFLKPINDAEIYYNWSRHIAYGGGEYGTRFEPAEAPYFLPPLYTYFSAFIERMSSNSALLLVQMQAALGVVIILGVHRLGVQAARPPGRDAWPARWPLLLFAPTRLVRRLAAADHPEPLPPGGRPEPSGRVPAFRSLTIVGRRSRPGLLRDGARTVRWGWPPSTGPRTFSWPS